MSDANYKKLEGTTPEYVAYRLLLDIMKAENKGPLPGSADKKYILDTYAEALVAVRTPEKHQARSAKADTPK